MAKEIYVPGGITAHMLMELVLTAFSREFEFDLGNVTYTAGNKILVYNDV